MVSFSLPAGRGQGQTRDFTAKAAVVVTGRGTASAGDLLRLEFKVTAPISRERGPTEARRDIHQLLLEELKVARRARSETARTLLTIPLDLLEGAPEVSEPL